MDDEPHSPLGAMRTSRIASPLSGPSWSPRLEKLTQRLRKLDFTVPFLLTASGALLCRRWDRARAQTFKTPPHGYIQNQAAERHNSAVDARTALARFSGEPCDMTGIGGLAADGCGWSGSGAGIENERARPSGVGRFYGHGPVPPPTDGERLAPAGSGRRDPRFLPPTRPRQPLTPRPEKPPRTVLKIVGPLGSAMRGRSA
jgi:hypothetical protein